MKVVTTTLGLVAIVAASIKLAEIVNGTLDDVKNAPEELQALWDRLEHLGMLLRELKRRKDAGFFKSPQDLAVLIRLEQCAQRCTDDIDAFAKNVQIVTRSGEVEVDVFAWIARRGQVQRMSKKLDRLEDALRSAMSVVVSQSLESIEREPAQSQNQAPSSGSSDSVLLDNGSLPDYLPQSIAGSQVDHSSDAKEDNATVVSNIAEPTQATVLVTLYRLYSISRDEHFYTTHTGERDIAVQHDGYKYEGPAAQILASPASNTVPLFRIRRNDEHFYTANIAERDNTLRGAKYAYTLSEGIAGYVYRTEEPNTVPLYRLYSSSTDNHYYTTNLTERNLHQKKGYSYEGIACFVYPRTASSDVIGSDAVEAELTKTPLYRLTNKMEHFYTADPGERDHAVRHHSYGFQQSLGLILAAPAKDSVPLCRIWRNGKQLYTIEAAERARMVLGQTDDGISGYVYTFQFPGTIPLYRLHHLRGDDHFYTTDTEEKDRRMPTGQWEDEGVACYIFPCT